MQKTSKKEPVFDRLISSKNISYEQLRELYLKLKGHIEIIEKNKQNIPLCVFSPELSSLETIVKYLKENLRIPINEISVLLGRSDKTIWQAYNTSKRGFWQDSYESDWSYTPRIWFSLTRLTSRAMLSDSWM